MPPAPPSARCARPSPPSRNDSGSSPLTQVHFASGVDGARALARVRDVADALGNTPAVARSSYLDPEVFKQFERGATIGLRGSRERALLDLLR